MNEVLMSGAFGNASSLDLNSASEQDLPGVGGLGLECARRIIQSRRFGSWDDVEHIKGFGDGLVEDLSNVGADHWTGCVVVPARQQGE